MYEPRQNLKTKRVAFAAVLLLIALLTLHPAAALRDPAAVYCTAMNYTFTLTTGANGGMYDTCVLPNHQKVDAWKFLQGEVAPEYSYCTREGYQIRTVNDSATCSVFMTQSCAVCVFPDGSTTEVTKLMKLDFRERLCSNGKCCDPKTDTSCSFSSVPAGIMIYGVIFIVIVIIALGIVLFMYHKKKKTTKP